MTASPQVLCSQVQARHPLLLRCTHLHVQHCWDDEGREWLPAETDKGETCRFTRLLSHLKNIKPTGGRRRRGSGRIERRIGTKSGRWCQNGATEGDGDKRRDGQKWMEGEQPLCNLSQHSTVTKQRER